MSDGKRRIVITGVTRGLGRALAEGLAAEGHTIFGCARSREGVERLRSEMGAPHAFSVVDVASAAEVERWAAGLIAEGGPPDLVINNAGLINRNAVLWEVPADEFSQVVDVNLKGPAYVMRAFLPAMIERGSGVIVNMSSGWGRSVAPSVAPYCATKWGVEGLSSAVARELPPGLAVAALNPGVIDTEMLRSAFGEGAGLRRIPANGRPAPSLAFWGSDPNRTAGH